MDMTHLQSDHHDQHAHDISPRDGLVRGILLAGMGLMLTAKVLEGSVPFYIHPRYTPLIAVTAVALLGVAFGHLRAGWRGLPEPTQSTLRNLALGFGPLVVAAVWVHSPVLWAIVMLLLSLPLMRLAGRLSVGGIIRSNSVWLALPIAFGLLIASRPLGTAALESKNVMNQPQSGGRVWTPRDLNDTSQWNLVDWATSLWQQPDPKRLDGKQVDVIGFVFRPKDSPDTTHVARFVVACCTADSSGVSLPVQSSDIAGLPTDEWVRVVGTLRLGDGKTRDPFIQASQVTVVPRPANPYLYP
jgi:putative membrane protein